MQGGKLNFLGTLYSNNEVAIKSIVGTAFSDTEEFAGVPFQPPLFRRNGIALQFFNKASGFSRTILTLENDIDLRLDEQNFNRLSDYISNTAGARNSTLEYLEHRELVNGS